MQPINEPSSMLLSNNPNYLQTTRFEDNTPKDKIQVSDDDDSSEDEDTDNESEMTDDDNTSNSSEESIEDDLEKDNQILKLKELNDEEIEHLERKNVKKITLQQNNNDDLKLSSLEVQTLNFGDNEGSLSSLCDESSDDDEDNLSELSIDDVDDTQQQFTHKLHNNIPSSIHVIKENHELENKEQLYNNNLSSISSILNNLQTDPSTQIDINPVAVSKKNTHNTSLKDKDEGEFKGIKVETLRQLAVDKSLATQEEAKKLKKKDLLAMLEEKGNL
jgi:hypothetical protein